jgi:F0F1-type ATP synthase membrane subunit b/b'
MASLNLTPEPIAVVVQAVVFFTGLTIVKKLILNPYLELVAKRAKLTVGSSDESKALAVKSQELNEQIQKRMNEAVDLTKKSTDEIRNKAQATKQSVLTAAEKDAKKHLNEMEKQLQADIATERSQLDKYIKTLSEQFYQRVLE